MAAIVLPVLFTIIVGAVIADTSTPGSAGRSEVRPVNPCQECQQLADRSFRYFTEYTFFKENQRDGVEKPWKKAGMQSCDEFRWAYQCFQYCTERLEPGVSFSPPPRVEHLKAVISKYCEPAWGSSKGCRMADTRVCDMRHSKMKCGQDLANYKNCINDVLLESDQDCSGVCTPATRFHKTLLFQWDMECKLQESRDRRCGDYINLFCFGEMKDTDLSWGYFDGLNNYTESQNLRNFCPTLHDPLTCLQQTVDEHLMYFGFNLSKPCASIAQDIQEIKQSWSDIIQPLCEGRPNGTVYVQELCGTEPTTQRMPSTTTTIPPPTTPLRTRRIKKRKRRINGASRTSISFGVASTFFFAFCVWFL